jgi:thioredoxin 1
MIESIKDTSFAQDVLESQMPVLVDFWAPWCAPCQAMAPALAEFAEKQAGRIKVVKMNIDDEPEQAMRLAVRSIPTLMLFENGAVVKTAVGPQSLVRLEQTFGR